MIVGAGRTDSGVHAFGQVVHVDLPLTLFSKERDPDPERLMRSLNQQLRGRIKVLAADPVGQDFSRPVSQRRGANTATWSSRRRHGARLTDVWSWSVQGPLDIDAMNRVSDEILGLHDFRAFCRRPTTLTRTSRSCAASRTRGGTPRRRMALTPDQSPTLKFTIRAESFCHNMVRCLTSVLVAIVKGRFLRQPSRSDSRVSVATTCRRRLRQAGWRWSP